ncbi:hypothetical protein BC939DRAFT_70198 [Gamsiella multidivaricata]|uniref:uncharacterized protein n=1 Tax=Gamsiella multidivaricata TaxID=101098 RepID=UPI00221ED241|nr:uncharacterized protein BC939DRAFT_70198 [Gamsiella multidivaricata]KAI7828182.1 hypothetical protein BC939DRAFT_70198 [Gamsiella multidivaricata]
MVMSAGSAQSEGDQADGSSWQYEPNKWPDNSQTWTTIICYRRKGRISACREEDDWLRPIDNRREGRNIHASKPLPVLASLTCQSLNPLSSQCLPRSYPIFYLIHLHRLGCLGHYHIHVCYMCSQVLFLYLSRKLLNSHVPLILFFLHTEAAACFSKQKLLRRWPR